MLYGMLKHFEQLQLFPRDLLTVTAQGESTLAYWLMHPNELGDAPSQIEFVEQIDRESNGRRMTFLVYRFRMPPENWAEKKSWMIGLSGPFFENDLPYSDLRGAFSLTDSDGQVSPAELVDWYVDLVTKKARN